MIEDEDRDETSIIMLISSMTTDRMMEMSVLISDNIGGWDETRCSSRSDRQTAPVSSRANDAHLVSDGAHL